MFSALLVFGVSSCSSLPKDRNPRRGLFEVMRDQKSSQPKKSPRSRNLSQRVTLGSSGGSGFTSKKGGLASQPKKSGSSRESAVRPSGSNRRLASLTRGWSWPLRDVTVTSRFGRRGKAQHEGIDLRAKVGTPVYAAHSGMVVYADDEISGYGRMIILRDSNGMFTLYAHNSRLKVSQGSVVKKGALLALSGNTGTSTGPHLHFEVRSGVVAVDPLKVLPADHNGAKVQWASN